MAAYMKIDMPFYGAQKPDRVPIQRELFARFSLEKRWTDLCSIIALSFHR